VGRPRICSTQNDTGDTFVTASEECEGSVTVVGAIDYLRTGCIEVVTFIVMVRYHVLSPPSVGHPDKPHYRARCH